MVRQNLHCHTTLDDGANTPEEMVLAAIDAGLTSLGISAHIPIEGESWCMPPEYVPVFKAEMARLKTEYEGKIRLYCGMEYDLSVPSAFDGFEYIIGSGHIVDGFYEDFDLAHHKLLIEHFGGPEGAAEAYFKNLSRVAEFDEIGIVGHFDLLTKYNEQEPLYDTSSRYFRDAAYAAMEKLCAADKIFEINTGAMSRGYRTSPYPTAELLRHLNQIGGKICISSDAHSASGITLGFDMCEELARSCGFTVLWEFDGEGFVPVEF